MRQMQEAAQVEIETLQTTNGDLISANKRLKREVDELTRRCVRTIEMIKPGFACRNMRCVLLVPHLLAASLVVWY